MNKMTSAPAILWLIAVLAGSMPAADTPAGSPEPTSPDQVLANYLQALGGREALQKVTSRVIKGTLEIPGISQPCAYEVCTKAPNKKLTSMEVPGLGIMLEGCNGKVCWSRNYSSSVIEKSSQELARARREAEFYRDLRFKEIFPRLAYKGVQNVYGRDACVIEAGAVDGAVEQFYFDAQTWLLVRNDSQTRGPDGSTRFQVRFSGHRAVDGIQVPHQVNVTILPAKGNEIRLNAKFTEVKHNVAIDDTRFEKPKSRSP